MTPQEILEELKALPVTDPSGKFIVDPKIDPLKTTPEEAKELVKQQLEVLTGKGISPENIGFIGLPKQFSELNDALDEVVGSLGAAFGGAFESFMNIDSYLSDMDDIIENKKIAAQAGNAELPENIVVDQSLVAKYARITGLKDIFGDDVLSFPDTFLPEERPINNKTPLTDWKDRSVVKVETAGGKEIAEKGSMFQAQYGKNVMVKSNNGHFIEMDDSEGAERINIQHKNGTFITLMPDQSIIIRAQGGIQQITYKDNDLFVKGNLNITVIGDANISTNGNTNIDTVGDVNWKVGGDFNLDVAGDTTVFNKTGDIKMTAKQIRQNAGDPRVLDDVKEKKYKLGS